MDKVTLFICGARNWISYAKPRFPDINKPSWWIPTRQDPGKFVIYKDGMLELKKKKVKYNT